MTRQEVKESWDRIKAYRNNERCVCIVCDSDIDLTVKLLKLLRTINFDKHWEVLKRFKEGCDIEFQWREWDYWKDIDKFLPHEGVEYRVKNKREPLDFDSVKNYIGETLIYKNETSYRLDAVSLNFVILHNSQVFKKKTLKVTYEGLAQDYTFDNGEPAAKPIN